MRPSLLLLLLLAAPALADEPAPFANLGETAKAFDGEAETFQKLARQALDSRCFPEDGRLWQDFSRYEQDVRQAVMGNVAGATKAAEQPYLGNGESCEAFAQVRAGMDRNLGVLHAQIPVLNGVGEKQKKIAQGLRELRAFRAPNVRCGALAAQLAAGMTDSSARILRRLAGVGQSYQAKITQLEGYRAQVSGLFGHCGSAGPAAAAGGKSAQGGVAAAPPQGGGARTPSNTITGVEEQKAKDEKGRAISE